MLDFAEFEIHVVCPADWAPPEAWLTMTHKKCGDKLGEDWDMVSLSTAAESAIRSLIATPAVVCGT